MSEERIVEVVNEALAAAGIEDMVTAAGEFNPRGHSGAGFAGGLIGGDVGDAIGSPAGGIGTAGGYLAGTRAHDPATGLPERMRVLELIDTESGSRIELEGMRLPITHSKDVIQELT